MTGRLRLNKPRATTGGAYFAAPRSTRDMISSGCRVLNCALGGGYPLGRVVNIVGDKSTGKTLLAIEACANFAAAYPKGRIYYCEVEAAFDKAYAEALGLPLDRVSFIEGVFTVEDWYEHLVKVLDKESKEPALCVLDSLDALSDRAEAARKIDEGTFGAAKAKQMSQLFRRLTQHLEKSRVCVFVISQVRDAIGVTFGRKTSRSGGRALDFYASQVVYLSQMGRVKRTVNKVERAVGVRIRALVDKNKVGLPFRECDFQIKFGYGVDDVRASVEFLESVDKLGEVDLTPKTAARFLRDLESMSDDEYAEAAELVGGVAEREWYAIEREFLPKRKKYQQPN